MAKILKLKLKEDYRIRRKNSGVYVFIDARTGEEHHTGYLNIKAAQRKKKQLESGGIPKRLKEDAVPGNHTGEAIAGYDPHLLKTRKKINRKEKKNNSRGKVNLIVRRSY